MREWLVDLVGEGWAPMASWLLAAAIVLILVFVVIWIAKKALGGTMGPRSKGRGPRLAVMDVTPLDPKRRLVLVRRDEVEHLLLIGGQNDVVVEASILRIPAAVRGQRTEPMLRIEPESMPAERPVPVPVAAAPAPAPAEPRAVAPAPHPPQPPQAPVQRLNPVAQARPNETRGASPLTRAVPRQPAPPVPVAATAGAPDPAPESAAVSLPILAATPAMPAFQQPSEPKAQPSPAPIGQRQDPGVPPMPQAPKAAQPAPGHATPDVVAPPMRATGPGVAPEVFAATMPTRAAAESEPARHAVPPLAARPAPSEGRHVPPAPPAADVHPRESAGPLPARRPPQGLPARAPVGGVPEAAGGSLQIPLRAPIPPRPMATLAPQIPFIEPRPAVGAPATVPAGRPVAEHRESSLRVPVAVRASDSTVAADGVTGPSPAAAEASGPTSPIIAAAERQKEALRARAAAPTPSIDALFQSAVRRPLPAPEDASADQRPLSVTSFATTIQAMKPPHDAVAPQAAAASPALVPERREPNFDGFAALAGVALPSAPASAVVAAPMASPPVESDRPRPQPKAENEGAPIPVSASAPAAALHRPASPDAGSLEDFLSAELDSDFGNVRWDEEEEPAPKAPAVEPDDHRSPPEPEPRVLTLEEEMERLLGDFDFMTTDRRTR